MDYLDFELEIGVGSGREYPVAVVRSAAGEAREIMRFPFDELALESRLKDVQIALLRSSGTRRSFVFPEESTVIDGEPESSVVVRFPVDEPPGRNSWTRPLTLSASPTLTVGVDEVKTKMPSEVAASESGLGSCIQKPLVLFAVTVPRVVTVWPLSGEMCDAPWMS